jgi:hypothetical protein
MRLKDAGAEAEKISDKALRRLVMQAGDSLETLLELIHADNISHADEFNLPLQIPNIRCRLEVIKQEMKKKYMPVSGKDLIRFFKLKPSEEIGKLLDRATEMWLENPDSSRDEILMKLDKEGKHGK